LDSDIADSYNRNENDDDHYSQAGLLFRNVMTDKEKQNTINNIVAAMSGISGNKRGVIILRQLKHFYRADIELANHIAKGLGFDFKP